MTVYYNENDPFASAWLRNLITANLIAQGEVDERSIIDVKPSDLDGFTQCHFFAGIGTWSYALRRAGWPDSQPVWTGSCPCQPFSVAGQRKGTSDERHLWPSLFWLVQQCRPVTIFGEQVASGDGLAWLDSVQAYLESADYSVGAVDSCAAGFGAPHIRQRLYWLADSQYRRRHDGWGLHGGCPEESGRGETSVGDESRNSTDASRPTPSTSSTSGLELSESISRQNGQAESERPGRLASPSHGSIGDMGLSEARGCEGQSISPDREPPHRTPQAGFWSDCDWLLCLDGKARPVEPGTFPLAYGIANRVGLLRGYGNSLVAPQAEEFIRAAINVLRP